MKQITPMNPSKSATARVVNPMPTPTVCPCCNNKVILSKNSIIYGGKEIGEWPWVYVCVDITCRASVGLHPLTAIPLGTLANRQTRQARQKAKEVFNSWLKDGGLSRNAAYSLLAFKMGLDPAKCHFAMFTFANCDQAIKIIEQQQAFA